jgi:glycosyltransferase involved in cell wall biosynthesis
MKVLLFCNLVPGKLGAYENLLIRIGEAFAEVGDELVLALAGSPLDLVEARLLECGVRYHVIQGWSEGNGVEHPWAFCHPALRLLRIERPDVAAVHFGNELPSLYVSLVAGVAGLGRTRWIWEQDQQIRDPSALTARVSALRALRIRFRHFLAVYEGGRESMRKRGIPGSGISVIHNSIGDYASSRADGWLHQELGIPADHLLLAGTASLISRKRVDFSIRAFAMAKAKTKTPIDLVVIGDGPERLALPDLIEKEGLTDSVHLLGARSDVREILAQADVYVHSALGEGCAYAITESMAAGLPAVVTEAGAANEQVISGKSGYVVRRDDMDAFASRIIDLVEQPDLRDQMGAVARHQWETHYRVETAAQRYHEMYRDLAAS